MRARKFFLLKSLKLDYTRDVKKAIHVIITCDLFNFLMNEKKILRDALAYYAKVTMIIFFLLQWLVKRDINEENTQHPSLREINNDYNFL